MTNDKYREYQNCKLRGHVDAAKMLPMNPPCYVCVHCGTKYHYVYEKKLVEYDVPKMEISNSLHEERDE